MDSNEKENKNETSKLGFPNGWDIRRLDEVSSVIDPWPSHRAPKIVENGHPYVGIGDISENGEIDFKKTRKVAESVILEQEANLLFDDKYIGLGKVGTVGKVVWVKSKPFRYALSATMVLIKPTSKIIKNFLYYVLNSPNFQRQLLRFMTGTTRPTIGILTLRTLEIPVPPMEEQLSISKILSDIDSKIELNQQMNKTLESIAQTLFKHWFIDFEFPDENGQPYKSSGGEMVESELGEIPNKWKIGKIKDLATVTSGKRPGKKSEVRTDEYNVELIGASSVMGYVKESLYNEKIILTGRVGTHGIIQRVNTPSWPSDNTLVIKSRHYEYIFQCLKIVDFDSLNVGSTQPLITQTQIKDWKIVIPPVEMLDSFEILTSSLFSKVDSTKEQNQTLSSIRDLLLPKLISGKIRVPVEDADVR